MNEGVGIFVKNIQLYKELLGAYIPDIDYKNYPEDLADLMTSGYLFYIKSPDIGLNNSYMKVSYSKKREDFWNTEAPNKTNGNNKKNE